MQNPRIKTTLIKALELKPGDLFSTRGDDYWGTFGKKPSIGEAVYIRTYADAQIAPDSEQTVFKIEIVEDESVAPTPAPASDELVQAEEDSADPSDTCTAESNAADKH